MSGGGIWRLGAGALAFSRSSGLPDDSRAEKHESPLQPRVSNLTTKQLEKS